MAQVAQVRVDGVQGRQFWRAWSDRNRATDPLAAALHTAIANDDELFALAQSASEGQIGERLLVSAVHTLLLNDAAEPLARYFPTVCRPPSAPDDIAPVLKAFCERHRSRIEEMVRTRTLQTTSTDRAAELLLGLDVVARSAGEPLSLIEVGCSAGLLLLFDQYRYEFGETASFGAPDAPVTSKVRLKGAPPPMPARFPTIGRRIGLDLNPIDLDDPIERGWVLGCAPLDRVRLFDNLRNALDVRAGFPLEIVKGDAMATLPPLIGSVEGPLCVYHSRCLYQWPATAQTDFDALLRRESRGRTIYRLALEWSAQQPPGATTPVNEIALTTYQDGASDTRLLGLVRNHDELEWLAG